jgi:hypothetical protein
MADVRAYFRCFQRVTSKQPDIKKLAERGIRSGYQRTPLATQSMTSQQAAEQSRTPFDSQSPGVRLYSAMASERRENNFTRQQTKVFNDSRVFRAALQLALLKVVPTLRLNTTPLELRQTLFSAGLKPNALKALEAYLLEFTELSEVYLTALVREAVATYGFLTKHNRAEPTFVIYLDYYQRAGITCLRERMFTELW